MNIRVVNLVFCTRHTTYICRFNSIAKRPTRKRNSQDGSSRLNKTFYVKEQPPVKLLMIYHPRESVVILFSPDFRRDHVNDSIENNH